MTIRHVKLERLSVVSSRGFPEVVSAFEAAIGHPETVEFSRNLAAANTFEDAEKIVQHATGAFELMQFMELDLGAVLRKKNGPAAPRSMRFILGNPVTMSRMLEHVPDAGSYAPVTVLIDERPDGVHLSYDKMASFLAPYGSPEALLVARELDAKVERLLTAAAG